MRTSELLHIIAAIILLFAISSFYSILQQDFQALPLYLLFSIIVIFVAVSSKKLMAFLLDSSVEHRLWTLTRYGYRPNWKFQKAIPLGIILPIFFSFFTLGLVKLCTFLTYETSALKVRAAKRFGYYSFTEMTEWHNALIGAATTISLLLLSLISYFVGFEFLSKISIYYAISNLIPISTLDGTQIFFGSKVLYITLLIITAIFFLYALILL